MTFSRAGITIITITVLRRASGAADRSTRSHNRALTAPPTSGGVFCFRTSHVQRMDYTKLDGLVPAVIQDAESGEVLMVGLHERHGARKDAEKPASPRSTAARGRSCGRRAKRPATSSPSSRFSSTATRTPCW